MGRLDGRAIVVTGAGRGIGAGIAEACAREGALVVVNDLGAAVDGTGEDKSPAQSVVDKIKAEGGTAIPHFADVSDTDQANDLIESAIKGYGKLDVLINLAGILRDRVLVNLEPEDWDAVIKVHLRGTYNTSRAAARHWRAEKKGHYRLINTTSGSGYFGAPAQPNYAAAKMGIIGFTYSCANALMRYGVTANALSPGGATRMNADVDTSKFRTGPAPASDGIAPPENAAPAVVYVASEQSGWFTGQVFASYGRSIRLLNKPAFIREIVTNDPIWSVDDVFKSFASVFRPAVESADNPHERNARNDLEERLRAGDLEHI
jgi:NAD(P)-dependent dehydrogenase (short-subunit alcohol dehydrogenase family)